MAKKKAAPQERAFLDEIGARSEDDAPRLVYADWLDDLAAPAAAGAEGTGRYVRLAGGVAEAGADDCGVSDRGQFLSGAVRSGQPNLPPSLNTSPRLLEGAACPDRFLHRGRV